MKSFKDLREKTLTPAEKKKREEIAKAMERENPGMDMKKKMAIATWQAKKVAEAKDPNEYDKEGDMMKNQLRQICSANEKLMKMVGDDDNLPEWVQNKVTKATDYIRSVRDYLDAENSDEDDEDESMEESVTISPLQKIRMDKEKADRNKDDKDKSQAKRMTDKQYAGYKVKMKEETEELDEISRDLARRYIRKVADKTNTGELSTKQVMKRKPGVTLAGKKAYPGVAGEPKVRATESVEQIDEISDKKLDAYRQKAFADQPSGDDGSDKYRKRKFGRDLAFDKQTGRAKVRATKEEVELDELNKSTLGSYIKKASGNMAGNAAVAAAQASSSMKKSSPDVKRNIKNRMTGIAKATDKLTKEEAEQIDELSKKTLGSYVKKAKDDLGNREAEVTRNRYVDPRGVKDPVKHNNTLLMKRANRRDNINKAVDKLTKEAVQSADRKPERYIRPDGKVGIRMVKTDKKMIKND